MPRSRLLQRAQDDDDALGGGLRRCDVCGGALRVPRGESDLVAACSCGNKQGMKARARIAGYSLATRDEVEELVF